MIFHPVGRFINGHSLNKKTTQKLTLGNDNKLILSFFLKPTTGMDDEDDDSSPLNEMLDDKLRVSYFKRYLAAVSDAMR